MANPNDNSGAPTGNTNDEYFVTYTSQREWIQGVTEQGQQQPLPANPPPLQANPAAAHPHANTAALLTAIDQVTPLTATVVRVIIALTLDIEQSTGLLVDKIVL